MATSIAIPFEGTKLPNRRIYSRERRGYITQDELLDLVREGRPLLIVDKQGHNVTTHVLMSAVLGRPGLLDVLFNETRPLQDVLRIALA